MTSFIQRNFLPVRIRLKEQPSLFKRFGTQWTPTIVVLDPTGAERRRFVGYLPPGDFLAQLELSLAHIAFAAEHWDEAEQRYRTVIEQFPGTDAAPEALYWAAVARYKTSRDPAVLTEAARQFKLKYPDSSWAKRSSVWAE